MPDHTVLEVTFDLLEETRKLLKGNRVRTSVLSRRASVGYHWLRNLRKGKIKNPGVIPLSKLYIALYNAR